jgi:Protein of unknown function (DUF3592)
MRHQKRVDIIIGWVITGLGVLVLGGSLWAVYGRYIIFTRWPTVEAEVAKSEAGGSFGSAGRGRGRNSVYYTTIEFQFLADGKQFNTSVSETSDNLSAAKLLAGVYAPGTRHTIRYNSANPNDIRFSLEETFMVPVVFVLVGCALVFIGLKWLQRLAK